MGCGLCPEFRGRGLGKQILGLALNKLAEMGIDRVLLTCDLENAASRKVILANGGVLENRVMAEDGAWAERYWIDDVLSRG